jgi:hypothetical protein
MKKIVFFNQFHNGDCFVGKNYVREIVRQLPDLEFEYAHARHPDIIKDLGIAHVKLDSLPALDRMIRVANSPDGETVYVNTWVGCWQGTLFPHGEHINFIRLHNIWREYFKHFKLDFVEDPNYYLPVIDYDQYDVSQADVWFHEHGDRPSILICNGTANSGQSRVGDLSACITKLSAELPEINIVLTHKLPLTATNIYYTDDIFAGQENDLNQIAYLAGGCDVIVGKNSGPFSYCQNAINLMNNALTFLNLSILATDCPSGGGLYKARCVHTAETNDERIANIIKVLLANPDYRGTEILA